MSDQPKDTRLWCLHHIGADDVYPAPDFATAQKWADWANTHFAEHADISRFVVAVWPHAAERHVAGLENSVRQWTVPTEATVKQSLTLASGARVDFLDMRRPIKGIECRSNEEVFAIMADRIRLAEAGHYRLPPINQPLPADVIALVTAGRATSEIMQRSDVSSDDRADVDAFDKALGAFASRVCWDDEGGALPDAHGDNCTCDLTGKGAP